MNQGVSFVDSRRARDMDSLNLKVIARSNRNRVFHKQQRPFHYGYVSDIRKKLKIKTTESCGQIVSLVLYFEKKIFHYAEDKSVSR